MIKKPKPASTAWNQQQIRDWSETVSQKQVRDYSEVQSRLMKLPANTHTVQQYGDVSGGDKRYPVYRVTVGDVDNGKPNILITAGVHGYEPSGVEAVIRFLQKDAARLTSQFNFVAYPCLSPWSYEFDQRWNWQAEDPNRSFSDAEGVKSIDECRHFMTSMEKNKHAFACAIDLHETSDRDIELRQMRADRFGSPLAKDFRTIPQGYYLILSEAESAGANGRQLLFGQSIIDKVRQVSPIAPEKTVLDKRNYGGVTLSAPSDGLLRTYLQKHAALVCVTEVYPNHPDMTPAKSVDAQTASIYGALNHVLTMK